MIESGLVADESVLAEFRRCISSSNGIDDSITAFTKYLVVNDILTCWQCAKLRNGKHKGFFIDSLRILDQIDRDEECDFYLARNEKAHKLVTMRVRRPSGTQKRASAIEYSIGDYP